MSFFSDLINRVGSFFNSRTNKKTEENNISSTNDNKSIISENENSSIKSEKSTIKSIGEVISDFGKNIKKLDNSIVELSEKVVKEAIESTNKNDEKVKIVADSTATIIQDITHDTTGLIRNTGRKIELLGDTTSRLSDLPKAIQSDLISAREDFLKSAEDFIDNRQNIFKKLEEISNKTAEHGDNFSENIKDFLSKQTNDISNLVADSSNKIDSLSKSDKPAQEILESSGNIIKNLGNNLDEMDKSLNKYAEKIFKDSGETINKDGKNQSAQVVSDIASKITKDITYEASSALRNFAGKCQTYGKVLENMGKLINEINSENELKTSKQAQDNSLNNKETDSKKNYFEKIPEQLNNIIPFSGAIFDFVSKTINNNAGQEDKKTTESDQNYFASLFNKPTQEKQHNNSKKPSASPSSPKAEGLDQRDQSIIKK